MIAIGIDVGTHTGVAVWDTTSRQFLSIETVKIHVAMDIVSQFAKAQDNNILVRYEDARQRSWYGTHSAKEDRARLQGAGSIKRDSVIWQDFLKDLKVQAEGIAPRRNITKLDAERFAKVTKYKGKTSEHGRDAAMLVFGI